MSKPPAAPAGLGAAGRRLWREMQEAFELEPHEVRVLVEACRTADELEQLQGALKASPPLVRGSTGQERPNPLFAEVRLHRAALGALVRQLQPRPSKDAAEVSRQASDAALTRWRGPLRVAK